MAFFRVGERYRDSYYIEHAVPFFDGELAIAQSDSKRYYLQSAHLQKQAPSQAVQQYRTLNHPLVIPFLEVYTEERSLVFIRPYLPIQPLREVISTGQVDEDQVVEWGKQLLQLTAELQSKPIPMYLLLDPRNIGLTDDGELKVFFCGLQQITALNPTLEWGTFFYSLLSGQYLEEPIDRVPDDFPMSKHMFRLIQKSLKNSSVDFVRSQIEAYEKRKHGKSLFSRLFGGEKKENPQQSSSSSGQKVTPPAQISESPSNPVRVAQPTVSKEEQQKEMEKQRLEQIRLEYERRQQELLEQLRRKQEELERLERERREKEHLEQELERERQERERMERERQERERQERERMKKEGQESERKERKLRKKLQEDIEQLQLQVGGEQERDRGTSANPDRSQSGLVDSKSIERQQRELERVQKEKEERERLLRERIYRESEEHAQLARQFEEYMKQMLNNKKIDMKASDKHPDTNYEG